MIMPDIIDRYRNKRDGQRKYTGHVLQLTPVRQVIATAYGDSLEQMRARKHAIVKALRELEESDTPNSRDAAGE